MNKCLPLVKQSQAEILLLLSDKIIDIDKSKNPNASTGKIVFNYLKNNCCDIVLYKFYVLHFIKVFEWCHKNHFELIVLEEVVDEMDITGIERVRQALYAHHWPNLKAKCKSFKL